MALSSLEPLFLMLRGRKEHSQGYHGQPDSDSMLKWGWITLQPMPGLPARGRGGVKAGDNSPAVPGSPPLPVPATELIGPPFCLWPPAAVFPGVTLHLHPVYQAQHGGCEVSRVGGGLGGDECPWGSGEGISEVHGGPQLLWLPPTLPGVHNPCP